MPAPPVSPAAPDPAAPAAPPIETWHLLVHGLVQGVGFRDSCVQQARRQGLAGWVRNRFDGSVELMVQGPPARLAALRDWLPHGVAAARVQRVHTRVVADAPAFAGFERRPSAPA